MHGIPMYSVQPELITFTYERTQYIFEGHKAYQDKFTLVTKESNAVRRTNAVCTLDDGKDCVE